MVRVLVVLHVSADIRVAERIPDQPRAVAIQRHPKDVQQGLENGLADTEVIFVGLSITISTSFYERNKFYFSSSIADTLCRRAAAYSLCLVPFWCRNDC
jgi:hypothetical protein